MQKTKVVKTFEKMFMICLDLQEINSNSISSSISQSFCGKNQTKERVDGFA